MSFGSVLEWTYLPREPRTGVLWPDGPSSENKIFLAAQRGFSHALATLSVTISSHISGKDSGLVLPWIVVANSGILPKINLQSVLPHGEIKERTVPPRP